MSGQSRALLALRWRMVRRPGVRVGMLLLLLLALAVLVLGALAAAAVPLDLAVLAGTPGAAELGNMADPTGEVAVLLPTAMLAFLATSMIGPIAAGGSYELLPASQLVAFPVRPRTAVRLSLLLTPLNIAWYLQLVLLTWATAYAIRGPYAPGLPLLVLFSYVLACTGIGQSLAWLVVGFRKRVAGRVVTRLVMVALVVAVVVIAREDLVPGLLDSSPTVKVLGAMLGAAVGQPGVWVGRTVIMVLAAAAGYALTVRAAGWALRRPGDRGSDAHASAPLTRRELRRTPYAQLLSIDRASIWRSAPLRRGLFVLGGLPAAAGLIAGLSWQSIALLPPLVASGAALLFGVNVFCLDGPGSVWIATLPGYPSLALRAKRRMVLEVSGAAVLVVVVLCGLRAGRAPTVTELVCVLGSSVGCVALVSAISMRLSVTRPHRADLQGPRDTPAPPGSMALYSLRLATLTTLLGVLFSLASYSNSIVAPVLITVGTVLFATWSMRRTEREWSRPETRARVVSTVSAG
ncbi:MAG TPA: hypothetical protein VIC82_01485 [Candidatus Nanopelagicales bacterium]